MMSSVTDLSLKTGNKFIF